MGPSLNKLHDDLKDLKPFTDNHDNGILSFKKTINLKNICYNYPNTSRTAIKDINLTIPVKSTVGLIGSTGSGKTTTVDIILGLLEAQKGNLEVDGEIITKNNLRSWQRSIGYVPQHIYLSDTSIKENIALGINKDEINLYHLNKCIQLAKLIDFISDFNGHFNSIFSKKRI